MSEAVASVLAQTVEDFEVLVVDDASSRPLYLPGDPRVHVIRHETSEGVSAARNAGIAAAQGEYVCFLDDDDLYTPERLAIAEEGLRISPVAACSKRFISREGLDPPVERLASDDVREFMASRWLHVGQLAVRRDLVPRFDLALPAAEDSDWAIRVVLQAAPQPVDRVGYVVRRHGENHLSTGRGLESVCQGRELVLSLRSDFFGPRPDLLAWQWKLLGGMRMQHGDRRAARRAFSRSIRARPNLSAIYHLLRTWL